MPSHDDRSDAPHSVTAPAPDGVEPGYPDPLAPGSSGGTASALEAALFFQLVDLVLVVGHDRADLDDDEFDRRIGEGIRAAVDGATLEAGAAGEDAARRALELVALVLRATRGRERDHA